MADSALDSKPAPTSSSTLTRWVPSLPASIISSINPFASDPTTASSKDGSSTPTPTSASKRSSVFASIFPSSSTIGSTTTTTTATTSPALASAPTLKPRDDDASLMFAEPDARSNSDASRDGSVIDDESGPRRKRTNRPKTSFSICHPPPASTARQRLHRRPRSLLQLHKLSTTARPQPAYEIVPSANFSVRLTKSITRLYKAKHSLCPTDLVVLKAEKYAGDEQHDEDQQARDIVALICKGKKEDGGCTGKAKICLPDGREWEAYSTTNGGYEFFTTDEHGLGVTARWVPKKGSRTREGETRKFNFSTISPNTRRHPVIANLRRSGLDINDTYRMPEQSGATPLNTPRQQSTILEDAMLEETSSIVDHTDHTTDDRLREIIILTSIWVLFKESWSPNFRYDDKDVPVPMFPRSPSISQHSPTRSGTFSPSSPPKSPALASTSEKRSSIRSISSSILLPGRRTSMLPRSQRGSRASITEDLESSAPGSPELAKTTRSRANSQSTVLVQRAASNRRKQATWRPDLLAAAAVKAERDLQPAAPIVDSRRDIGSTADESSDSEDDEHDTARPSHAASSTATDTTANTTASESIPAPAPTTPAKKGRKNGFIVVGSTTAVGNKGKVNTTTTTTPGSGRKRTWRRLFCGSSAA